jgi:hypothetical protein
MYLKKKKKLVRLTSVLMSHTQFHLTFNRFGQVPLYGRLTEDGDLSMKPVGEFIIVDNV